MVLNVLIHLVLENEALAAAGTHKRSLALMALDVVAEMYLLSKGSTTFIAAAQTKQKQKMQRCDFLPHLSTVNISVKLFHYYTKMSKTCDNTVQLWQAMTGLRLTVFNILNNRDLIIRITSRLISSLWS